MDVKHIGLILIILIAVTTSADTATSQTGKTSTAENGINVIMSRYDENRTGVNPRESLLTTANVNKKQFGKLFSVPVAGDIYAQPLVVTNLEIAGGVHNVVYVATMHNEVYAFDADSAGPPLWHINLGPIFDNNISAIDITGGEVGVLSTPAIDLSTRTIYVVSQHNGELPTHKLHALDMITGAEKLGGPTIIRTAVVGTSSDSDKGLVFFHSNQQLQRPGLVLANGHLYIMFGSTGDNPPFHGWVIAYPANDITKVSNVWVSTASGQGGGIWMSGAAASVDAQGNLYVSTGNGRFEPYSESYGDSVVKLDPSLTVTDYFTPHDQDYLSETDSDLGSTTPVIIPDMNLLITGGKNCKLYLIDMNNLGNFQPDSDSQIRQSFCAYNGHLHNSPVVWDSPQGKLIYIWSELDFVKAYRFTDNQLDPIPFSTSSFWTSGMPAGVLVISSNGRTPGTGIAWTVDDNGLFRAVDATDLTHVLWTDRDVPERDNLGKGAKFCPPTVANGKVYMATRANQLVVYGLIENNVPR